MTRATYFENHARRTRFPWMLYHRELDWRIARALGHLPREARVLVVGCGLDPIVEGIDATFYGSDIDARAIDACQRLHPEMKGRLRVSPSPFEQPDFAVRFDAVVAKEVIEHTDDPSRFARSLADLLAPGGKLILTTPNYGTFSTLALLERTVLEWVARRDGYSRAHIHPSRFDRDRLSRLDVGSSMQLAGVETTWSRWALVGVWQKSLL